MSNPGEWIDFAELCARVKTHGLNRSASTLRRYCKDRLISYRQAVRRGRVEFNWKTVERELRTLDAAGANALRMIPDTPPDLVREVHELKEMITAIAARLNGIPAELLAGEHPAEGRKSA